MAGTNFIGTTDNVPLELRSNNSRVGYAGLSTNTSWGLGTLPSTSTGTANTGLGRGVLVSNTTGSNNLGVGAFSLLSNTTGTYNSAIGSETLESNTTGSSNIAIGWRTMFGNMTGNGNVAVGTRALYNNLDRHNIVAIGDSALFHNSIGAGPISPFEGLYPAMFNTGVGSKVLFNNRAGYSNSGFGQAAMYNNNGGSGNTAMGNTALYANISGVNNTAVGNNAGNQSSTNPSNFMALGYLAGYVGSNSNEIEVGNQSVSWIGGQTGWFNYSDGRVKERVQENVAGLDFINRLRPVTYHFDVHKEYEMVHGSKDVGEWEGKYDLEKRQMTGFIAQEVEAAAKASGYDFSGVRAPEGTTKLYSLSYGEFVVPLVKAVQEQQILIEAQQRAIDELREELRRMR